MRTAPGGRGSMTDIDKIKKERAAWPPCFVMRGAYALIDCGR